MTGTPHKSGYFWCSLCEDFIPDEWADQHLTSHQRPVVSEPVRYWISFAIGFGLGVIAAGVVVVLLITR